MSTSSQSNVSGFPAPPTTGRRSTTRSSGTRGRKSAVEPLGTSDLANVVESAPTSPRSSTPRPPSPRTTRSRKATIPTLNSKRSPIQSPSTPRTTRKKPIPTITPRMQSPMSDAAEVQEPVIVETVSITVEEPAISTPPEVETELVTAGYVPLDKVVVERNNGELKAEYIRATNKLGQTVFVLIDTDSHVTVNPEDLSMIEARGANIVPYSMKMGAYESAGTNVSGVAFDCEEAICTLVREGVETTPRESNFVYTSKRSDSIGAVGDDLIASPIVRLSEIRENPQAVIRNTDVAIRRIRNAAYKNVLDELTKTQQSIRGLIMAFNRFNATREALEAKLNSSIKYLETLSATYTASPPANEQAWEKYGKVVYNLKKRNELIIEILRASRAVAMQRACLDQHTREMNEITEHLATHFSEVDGVIEPRTSAV